MARIKNIEKVASAIGGKIDRFSDNSGSWVAIEDDNWVVDICFDGKGDIFQGITIAKKIYQVVDQQVIAEVTNRI